MRRASSSKSTRYASNSGPSTHANFTDVYKRQVPSWDEYFLEICRTVSRRSKDPHTKLGAVVVGPAHEIRATGYNSLVRGIRDDVPERLERPEKYLWMEHAERNAIYNAARHGTQMRCV